MFGIIWHLAELPFCVYELKNERSNQQWVAWRAMSHYAIVALLYNTIIQFSITNCPVKDIDSTRIIQPASAQNDQNKSTDIPHPEICKRLMTPGENTVPTKLHTDVMTKWNYWWEFGKVFQWCTFDKTLPPPLPIPTLFIQTGLLSNCLHQDANIKLKTSRFGWLLFLCPFYFFSPNNMHCIQNYNVALYWGCKLIQSKFSLSNLHLTH